LELASRTETLSRKNCGAHPIMDEVFGDTILPQVCNAGTAKSVTAALRLVEVFEDRVQRASQDIWTGGEACLTNRTYPTAKRRPCTARAILPHRHARVVTEFPCNEI